MHKHHEQALSAFVETAAADETIEAVITSGSIANGTAKESSDIDVYVVVTPAEYEARVARNDLAIIQTSDYPGGYIDGKVISAEVLYEAAKRGTEPMRASFIGSTICFSRMRGLDELVARIPVYPEESRAKNMRDFFAVFSVQAGYFGPQALERGDSFLAVRAIADAVLYAGRLMLTFNRVLFPSPKQLLATVGMCPHLPDGFLDLSQTIVRIPSPTLLDQYINVVSGFADWGLLPHEALTVYMALEEWSWIDGCISLAQR